jgi:hypothetical protein
MQMGGCITASKAREELTNAEWVWGVCNLSYLGQSRVWYSTYEIRPGEKVTEDSEQREEEVLVTAAGHSPSGAGGRALLQVRVKSAT